MAIITLYYTSVSSSMEIKKKQQKIQDVLESKKIEFTRIDISADSAHRVEMREIVGNEKALPPQLVSGTSYCGDYEAFFDAVEDGSLQEFLKL